MGSRHVTLLEVPLVGLGQLEHFPETSDTTSAVATIPLVVGESDAMLLLPVTNQAKDWNLVDEVDMEKRNCRD